MAPRGRADKHTFVSSGSSRGRAPATGIPFSNRFPVLLPISGLPHFRVTRYPCRRHGLPHAHVHPAVSFGVRYIVPLRQCRVQSIWYCEFSEWTSVWM